MWGPPCTNYWQFGTASTHCTLSAHCARAQLALHLSGPGLTLGAVDLALPALQEALLAAAVRVLDQPGIRGSLHLTPTTAHSAPHARREDDEPPSSPNPSIVIGGPTGDAGPVVVAWAPVSSVKAAAPLPIIYVRAGALDVADCGGPLTPCGSLR